MGYLTSLGLVDSKNGITQLVSKAVDILTLDEAKAELGIVSTLDEEIDSAIDARINALIATVQQFCEQYVYKTYGSETIRTVSFPSWPDKGIYFDAPPLISVDEITYLDSEGAAQTLADTTYDVFTPENGPGYLIWNGTFTKPSVALSNAAVNVTYTSGGPVPAVVNQAARMMLSKCWDDNRPDRVLDEYELGAERMLAGERWGDYA